jgi:hypothetical protein
MLGFITLKTKSIHNGDIYFSKYQYLGTTIRAKLK